MSKEQGGELASCSRKADAALEATDVTVVAPGWVTLPGCFHDLTNLPAQTQMVVEGKTGLFPHL